MVSTAPTCAACGATINGHPLLVRTVDEGGAFDQPVCSLDCAEALADGTGGEQD